MRDQSCSERIAGKMTAREELLEGLYRVADMSAGAEDVRGVLELSESDELPTDCDASEQAYDRLWELPLSVERETVVRIVISTGGPHDEIRAFVRDGAMYRAEYVFQDWFDSATLPVPEDSALWRYAESAVEMHAD